MGAAWASVAGYAVFSGVGLLRYRRIQRIDYPLSRCGLVLLAMIGSYVGCRYLQTFGSRWLWSSHWVWTYVAPSIVWSAWAIALLYQLIKNRLLLRSFAAAA